METKKYGLIGNNLEHSFSRHYFNLKFEQGNINAQYENFPIEAIHDFKLVLKAGFNGCNVTMPYKERVIPYLDELSEEAAEIGAVNTISFKNGKSIGYNTDVYGFKQMIKPYFKSHHERAMIIGTGGAAKAVAYVLEKMGVTVIFISRFPNGEGEFSYEDINENMIKFNGLIVNTTPVGMYPNIDEEVHIPYQHITSNHLIIDLIYNPEETIFLKKAKAKGAWVLNGLTMLQQQAEKAWEIWNT